jgi:hypothetical protein
MEKSSALRVFKSAPAGIIRVRLCPKTFTTDIFAKKNICYFHGKLHCSQIGNTSRKLISIAVMDLFFAD